MSKTIENNEVQVPNTPEMNDRDIATEILTTEKHLSDAYSVFLNEASNENLFNKILSIFEQTQKKQRSIYELMYQKGWYKISIQDKKEIEQSYNQFNEYKTQLN